MSISSLHKICTNSQVATFAHSVSTVESAHHTVEGDKVTACTAAHADL